VKNTTNAAVEQSPLGRASELVATYTPSLLHSIERSETRRVMGIDDDTPIYGEDIWNCHELSWLNSKGLPQVASIKLIVPASSAAIVESKSLKLYLNSFAQTHFLSLSEITSTLESDLRIAFRAPVIVAVTAPNLLCRSASPLPGENLDLLDIEASVYQPELQLLGAAEPGSFCKKTWHSHLFRTLCPVTGQPDLASVLIDYAGPELAPAALLRYLVSYRTHQAFHEATVEKIFMDLRATFEPHSLSVYGRFLRRGGIDINPYRATFTGPAPDVRGPRQ